MRTHIVLPSTSRPRHAVGEIALATVGNYIEDRNANAKPRPVVILRVGECQHSVAALTTQATFKTTGEPRVPLPISRECRLWGESFLWSAKPSRVCRLDLRWHIGWIGHDEIDVIDRYMGLPWHVLAALRAAADDRTPGGEVPPGIH